MARSTGTFVDGPVGQRRLIPDLAVAWIGHFPRKRHREDLTFRTLNVNFIAAGKGSYWLAGQGEQRVGPGAVFVTWPGHELHYGPSRGGSWEEYFLMFAGAGLHAWRALVWLPPPGRIWQAPDPRGWRRGFREVGRLLKRGAFGDAERALLLVERMFLDLYCAQERRILPRVDRRIDAAVAWCRQHYAERVDLRTLARRHHMSYSTLRQGLRRLTGLSPVRYVAHVRCERAKQLLAASDLSIKQIGAAVGLPHPVIFCRTFHRCAGTSPTGYRAALEDAQDGRQSGR